MSSVSEATIRAACSRPFARRPQCRSCSRPRGSTTDTHALPNPWRTCDDRGAKFTVCAADNLQVAAATTALASVGALLVGADPEQRGERDHTHYTRHQRVGYCR